jgi:ribonuclease HII
VVHVLAEPDSVVVVDQVDLGVMAVPIRSQPKADERFFCVAAASVVAKVHRDRLMAELSRNHPHWGWSKNRGYGTLEHRKALEKHGRSYLHRKSFRWSPVLP